MKKILIANRGEIAVRVIRACADEGLKSVAVYADPDVDALHVRMADEAYALEGNRPAETYLNIEKLLAVAKRSGADTVHPGYGFLSENASFAQAVIDAGLIWIGPSPQSIERLGNKVEARKIAQKVGAPLVAGTAGPVKDAEEVLAFAREYGLPVAIKAAYGGGGRGMKVAREMHEVVDLYESATREAMAAFGNGACFVEQFLDQPRHVEAQIIADTHGHIVVVGTRDCSLQRRNQKLVEEAPAPFLTDAQRRTIEKAAHDVCAEAGYTGAGTVEFLLSAQGVISFLEVNTRLQVEHTVTEEATGVDLVIEQFRVAQGLPLSITETPKARCHAMEFRINAEDPGRGFIPTPGLIRMFAPPSGPGVRLDSGVESGSTVPGTFDSMMAKLIITGKTREQAIARARRALAEFRIDGVASTLPFFRALMDEGDFISAKPFKVYTNWIETAFTNRLQAGLRPDPLPESELLRTVIEVDGKLLKLGLPVGMLNRMNLSSSSGAAKQGGADPAGIEAGKQGQVVAPISGTLLAWKIDNGAAVKAGDVIAVMEAMKMEMQVTAPVPGTITLMVEAGSYHDEGSPIAKIA